jgi:G3E family GTPase
MDDSFSTDLIIDPYGGDHGDIRNLEIAEHDHGDHGHAGYMDHDDHEDHDDQEDHDDHEDHDHQEAHDDQEAHEHRSGGRKLYHHQHERVETVFYTTERTFLPERFGQFLNSLPSGLARAKGFLQFGGPKADGAKYLLQVVGARPDLQRRDWAADEARRSALVFIGRDIDPDGLRLRLDACLDYSA